MCSKTVNFIWFSDTGWVKEVKKAVNQLWHHFSYIKERNIYGRKKFR